MYPLMHKAGFLSRELHLKSYKGKNIYHNTKLLLQLYNKVLWRMEYSLNEMNTECFYLNKTNLADAIGSLLDMKTDLDRLNLESRLESLDVSRVILELINKALVLLKSYPDKGERYFDILNKMYIIKCRFSENEMLEYLNIGRTTFYKDKKDAIHMLGVILWGFLIPDLKSGLEGEKLVEKVTFRTNSGKNKGTVVVY
ncbi:MAG: hypothetical protein N2645_15450 [Clostridia bacterium]|nr:hypothetical protein [Clostridia bacterium]